MLKKSYPTMSILARYVFIGILLWSTGWGIAVDKTDGKPWMAKIGPVLRELYERRTEIKPSAVGVFIRTDDPEVLKQSGVGVRTVAGDIVTATVTLDQLPSITAMNAVTYITAGSVCRSLLDKSIPDVRADQLWDGFFTTEYRGQGMIIGIYDSGIDWSHPDFIDESGQSRILYLWDQTCEDGDSPDGFGYGSEYNRQNINDEIDGSPAGIVQGKDVVGHGTHVAGIAAGNGRATGNGLPSGVYVGVASEAELIVVKGGDGVYMTDPIIDGIRYIFQKAEALSPPRPAVINLSVGGTHRGPHDGTSAFEQAIDNILNEKAGRAIVTAAGNDGDYPPHFGMPFSIYQGRDTLVVTFSIDYNAQDREDFVSFDVWHPALSDLEVTVTTPGDVSYGPLGRGESETWEGTEGRIFVNNAPYPDLYPGNGQREVWIRLSDGRPGGTLVDNLTVGTWTLLFAGLLYSDDPEKEERFDGWLCESSMNVQITSGSDRSIVVAEPGNSRLCIAVGSYVSRDEWPSMYMDPYHPGGLTVGALSDFSSPGPTWDNRQKPDIVAPGEYILSSLSSFIDPDPIPHETATDGVHWTMKGTSMSAPHVTGVVALMFQADPDQWASEIRGHLIFSARKTASMGGEEWTKDWGFGKLDAVEAMRRITDVSDDDEAVVAHSFSLSQNFPNPFNGKTVIEYRIRSNSGAMHTVSLDVYDVMGRHVRSLVQVKQNAGDHDVSWDGCDEAGNKLASGVYVYRLIAGHTVMTRKMVYLR